MPDGDINWLFSDVFRRLALVLEKTKNKEARKQLQIITEGVGAIKKLIKPKDDRAAD